MRMLYMSLFFSMAVAGYGQSSIMSLRNPFVPFFERPGVAVSGMASPSGNQANQAMIDSATPSPEPVEDRSLPVLQSIAIRGGSSQWALVDNRLVTTGSSLYEFRVVAIDLTSVQLSDGERTYTLLLEPNGRGAFAGTRSAPRTIPHRGMPSSGFMEPSDSTTSLMDSVQSANQILGPMLDFMYPGGLPGMER